MDARLHFPSAEEPAGGGDSPVERDEAERVSLQDIAEIRRQLAEPVVRLDEATRGVMIALARRRAERPADEEGESRTS